MGLKKAVVPAQLVGSGASAVRRQGAVTGLAGSTELLGSRRSLQPEQQRAGSHSYRACPVGVHFLATTFHGQFVLPLTEFLLKENITRE